MLSAAAFNFKKAMRLLLRLFSNGFAESTAMMKNLAGTSHRELNIPHHSASSQSVFTYLKEELFEGLLIIPSDVKKVLYLCEYERKSNI